MLQLLISILMLLGFSADRDSSGKLKINDKIVIEARASANFNNLGGDAVMFQEAVISSDPLNDVVVVVSGDPIH